MVRLKEMNLTIENTVNNSLIKLLNETLEKIEGIEYIQYISLNNILSLKINLKKISFNEIEKIVKNLGFKIHTDEIILNIQGMHCASCVLNVENFLMRLNGVFLVKANLTFENVKIICDLNQVNIKDFEDVINKLGFKIVEEDKVIEDNKLLRILIGLIFSIILVFIKNPYLSLIIAIIPFFYVSFPILNAGFKTIKSKNLNMDVMYSMGILVAFISSILGTFFNLPFMFYSTSLMLPSFLTIGRYLEEKAKNKTTSSIKNLIGLQPKIANKIMDGKEKEIAIENIKKDDILLVKEGEQIPVDGIIIEGNSHIDESMISGESVPLYKSINDVVLAGCINKEGIIKIKVTKIGKETILSNIIRLVKNAQNTKPPIQKIADKIVAYFIPTILFIAIVIFLIWYFIFNATLLFSITTLISILVVACPCALGLATPTAITVGMGRASEFGILIKNGEVLENVCDVDMAIFDKTGTLTKGEFIIEELINYNISKDELITIIYNMEKNSNHPIAKSIVCSFKNVSYLEVKNFKTILGCGINGEINGDDIFIGNDSLENIVVKRNNEIIGEFKLIDQIKEESPKIINKLHEMGIKTIILTGDNEKTALNIGSKVGIDHVESKLLPSDKLSKVKEFQKNNKVLFIGDGINDAPSLTQADIGIAMGNGTDIAMESSDIVIMDGKLENVVAAIEFSKKVMTRIKQNIFWAFAYNIILIPCAAGILYPFFGIIFKPEWAAFAMALSSITVILFSLTLKNFTPKIK